MANQVMLASRFGKDVADLLGLKQTREITIRMRYDDFVEVNVEALLAKDDGEKFTSYLSRRKYILVLVDEEEPEKLPGLGDRWPGMKIVETMKNGDAVRTYAVAVAE